MPFTIDIKVAKFEMSLELECSRCHCMRDSAEFIGRAGKVMKTCNRCRTGKALKRRSISTLATGTPIQN